MLNLCDLFFFPYTMHLSITLYHPVKYSAKRSMAAKGMQVAGKRTKRKRVNINAQYLFPFLLFSFSVIMLSSSISYGDYLAAKAPNGDY